MIYLGCSDFPSKKQDSRGHEYEVSIHLKERLYRQEGRRLLQSSPPYTYRETSISSYPERGTGTDGDCGENSPKENVEGARVGIGRSYQLQANLMSDRESCTLAR